MNPAPRARTRPAPDRAALTTTSTASMPDEPDLPRSGDVLEVSRHASVQFADPMPFRVIRVLDWPTYTGWIWLDGYQLNLSGEAVERRSIFVQIHGLRRIRAPGNRSRPGRK